MSSTPLYVVKVGGSLFDWPELPHRLTQWLAGRGTGGHLLVAGGGELGDGIRNLDARFSLGEELSHWLCVDALSISARILSRLLGDMTVIDSLGGANASRARGSHSACIFDPRRFLLAEESARSGERLPHSWDATTDSIAARLAECLSADQLVLLKSDDVPQPTIEFACGTGFVDRHFAVASWPLKYVGYVNLRRGDELIELRSVSP